jgi:hypothetical protein
MRPVAAANAVIASVLGSGGGTSSATGARISGTAGQGVIGTSSDGVVTLSAGFWSARAGVTVGVEPPPLHVWRNALHGSHPNPFNPMTTIDFEVGEPDDVRLEIFDLEGRRVRVLLTERRAAGPHRIRWDGADDAGHAIASGVYLCRLSIGSDAFAGKLLLLR